MDNSNSTENHKWHYTSKQNTLLFFIGFAIFSILLVTGIFILAESSSRFNFMPTPIFVMILCFIFVFMIFFYRVEARRSVNTKNVAIPIKDVPQIVDKEKWEDFQKYYIKIVEDIGAELEKNNIEFEKKQETELTIFLPWSFSLYIKEKDMLIRIMRDKYVFRILVGNVLPDNEIFFDQIIKKSIDNVIQKI